MLRRSYEVPSIGVVQFLTGLESSKSRKIARRRRALAWGVTALIWTALCWVLICSI